MIWVTLYQLINFFKENIKNAFKYLIQGLKPVICISKIAIKIY